MVLSATKGLPEGLYLMIEFGDSTNEKLVLVLPGRGKNNSRNDSRILTAKSYTNINTLTTMRATCGTRKHSRLKVKQGGFL